MLFGHERFVDIGGMAPPAFLCGRISHSHCDFYMTKIKTIFGFTVVFLYCCINVLATPADMSTRAPIYRSDQELGRPVPLMDESSWEMFSILINAHQEDLVALLKREMPNSPRNSALKQAIRYMVLVYFDQLKLTPLQRHLYFYADPRNERITWKTSTEGMASIGFNWGAKHIANFLIGVSTFINLRRVELYVRDAEKINHGPEHTGVYNERAEMHAHFRVIEHNIHEIFTRYGQDGLLDSSGLKSWLINKRRHRNTCCGKYLISPVINFLNEAGFWNLMKLATGLKIKAETRLDADDFRAFYWGDQPYTNGTNLELLAEKLFIMGEMFPQRLRTVYQQRMPA